MIHFYLKIPFSPLLRNEMNIFDLTCFNYSQLLARKLMRKYPYLCFTLLTKINSTHIKNLLYTLCFIAFVGGSGFHARLSNK
jgi:hypothetical protein